MHQVQPNLKCFPVNKNKTKIPILEGLGAASKDAKLFFLFIIQNRFWNGHMLPYTSCVPRSLKWLTIFYLLVGSPKGIWGQIA